MTDAPSAEGRDGKEPLDGTPGGEEPVEEASEQVPEQESEPDDLIDEQGLESFPASDPPSNWAGEG